MASVAGGGACAETTAMASDAPNTARQKNRFTRASGNPESLQDLGQSAGSERTRPYPTLNPLKVLLDLAPRDAEHHRPSVRTDGRIGGAAQLLENVRHLFVGQRVVRLDRGVTCRGCGDALDRGVHAGAAVEPFEILRERPKRG